jgi:co-chaperonin GroES (HSP10)
LKPLFDRVLLKRPKLEKVGSIFIPQDQQKRQASLKCEIVAVGPGVSDGIQPGMKVLIGQYAGEWFDSDGKVNPEGEFYICTDADLIAEVCDD